MTTERYVYVPYKPIYDGSISYIIETGKYREPNMRSQLESLGIQILETPGKKGDCQSWTFEYLGLPELAHRNITLGDLKQIGFRETEEPTPEDLAFYWSYYHFGIFYDVFHGERRVISKLGIEGAVCIHPWNAFTGACNPRYFKKTLNP